MIRSEIREENILWITFDDPASRNAMDAETMQQLADTWRQFAADDAERAAEFETKRKIIDGANDAFLGVEVSAEIVDF